MKKQIIRFSVLQNAKVVAVLYLLLSVLFVACALIPVLMTGQVPAGMSLGMFVLMPLLYALFGFIFTVIGAWIYNFVARMVGGLEFATVEVNHN
jgi:hypothetical protein